MQKQINKIAFLILFLTSGFNSFSQDQVYSDKLLKKLEEIRNHSHSNAKIAGKEESHRECVSMLLHEAKKNHLKLTAQAQEVFSTLGARPSLSGTELTYPTTHFRIHYTKVAGADAVSTTDIMGNGIPDFVDTMAAVFEYVYQQEIVIKGYSMAPADGVYGGDSKYDVYIKSIGTGLYGYVSSDDFKGNNPNSPQTETDAWTSFMVMNNNYSWVKGLTKEQAIKVTAAHEFFHAIQYGITIDCSTYFAESTATWMEDIAYPKIDDNFQYLSSIFRSPDVALDLQDSEDPNGDYDGHWYGCWIFWRYVTDHYGVDIIKKIWIDAISDFENDAYESEFQALGTSYREVFNDWLIANQLMTNNSTFAPYTYSRASDYSTYLSNKYSQGNVVKEKTSVFTGATIVNSSTTTPGNSTLMRLSADYFTISSNSNFSVTLDPTNTGKDFELILIKSNSGNSNFEVVNGIASGNSLIINVADANLYNQFTVLVSRFDAGAAIGSEQYALTINNVISGVSDGISNVNSKIYPNPASKEFRLDYTIAEPSTLEVIDLAGKSMFNTELEVGNKDILPIDASTWNPGVYIVIIKNQEGVVDRQRLVINK